MKLEDFCADKNDPRYFLHVPWTWENYSYATNGHIAIRVPALAEYPVAETDKKIHTQTLPQMFIEAHANRNMQLLPAYDKPALPPCPTCQGSGYSQECDECEGEGEVEFENTYNRYHFECRSCDGDGDILGGKEACKYCNGSGKQKDVAIKCGPVFLNFLYLELIETLPGLRIDCSLPDNDTKNPVPFVFDGGEGLLMTMRVPNT